jgi:hypothetical protein
MNAKEQKSFVKELGKNVLAELYADIDGGKVPAEWDGIELRQLLADRFSRCVFKGYMTGKRKRNYNLNVLVNNL